MSCKQIFTTFLDLLVLALALGAPESRIFGGEDATSGQHPWVASVRVNFVHTCVGTIISDRHILTAGHCVSQRLATPISASSVSVRVGSINQYSGGSVVNVQSIVINRSIASFLHDVAILTLSAPLTFTNKIQKIDFADKEFALADDTPVTVTGWGLQKSGASPYKLQEATYSVLNPQLCELKVGYGYASILCLNHAVNEGICTGDDGAGVLANGKLVGVISFAFGSCGTEFPDIASKVSYYSDWIQRNIQ